MIEVKGLTKYYGAVKAVDNISFSVKKGEVVGILGPNGAGKSTTIRILCCYLSPTAGSVEVNAYSVTKEPRRVKSLIGYLAEAAPLYHDMMVLDYLSYILKVRAFPKARQAARIEEIADVCGLRSVMHKNINELSKGFKQRVGLAHALLGDPEILVLDEPTAGLDPNQIVEIRKLIRKIGEHRTVLLSSHILSEVEVTCDRVIIIHQGKIVADGKTAELSATMGTSRTLVVEFSAGNPAQLEAMLTRVSGIRAVTAMPATERTPIAYALSCAPQADVRAAVYQTVVTASLPLIGLYERAENLESIFRGLTATTSAVQAQGSNQP